MLDWVGSLRVQNRTSMRVELSLSRTTRLVGWVVVLAGFYATIWTWPLSHWYALVPLAIAAAGIMLVTLRRKLDFDRDAGVLRIDQRTFGIGRKTVVPLFHLRAVIVAARGVDDAKHGPLTTGSYVAYVERRVGAPIYLDESRRCAKLLKIAEIIADVAELRLEYDATAKASN